MDTDALQQAREDLHRIADATGRDLRRPVRSIIGYLDLLRDHVWDSLGADARTYLARAQAAARRMDVLIDGLVAMEQLAAEGGCARRRVALDNTIAHVCFDLRAMIRRSRAKLDIGDLPEVHASPPQMVTLFRHLLANALTFRRADAPPKIRVRGRREDDQVVIYVEDEGIGIPIGSERDAVGLFRRLDPRYPGEGIGLAVAKRIVDLHGGDLSFERLDRGTSVRVRLPA